MGVVSGEEITPWCASFPRTPRSFTAPRGPPETAALVEVGVRAVGIRAVNEIRPAPTPTGEGIVIGRQRWVDVTGYHAGVLYVLRLPDADPDPIEADLEARGFTVRSRSDNVT
jgi:hypothetical protein